jgi:RNA polymerase sigma factor (TIGR02999 family)
MAAVSGESASPTELLLAWGQGEAAALDRLMPLVHGELRQLARRYMARERPNHTLQPTALVNEAYLRLIEISRVQWRNRTHFLAMAARVMRRILVDVARAHRNGKRGGGVIKVGLDEAFAVADRPVELVALDEALRKLSAISPRQSQVVELHFFGGLTLEEAADVLEVSRDTVKRDWRFAKLWLLRELSSVAPA